MNKNDKNTAKLQNKNYFRILIKTIIVMILKRH